ncbi:MAG: winged helix-turn-helix transcriptional regulator [Myxococcaceae bacterium]|nr:winged helix-turn-helix transcriptional regulator [Myxococcaceae bacterium]
MSVGDQIVRVCRTTNRLLARRISESSQYSYLQLRALRIIDVEGIRTQVALGERLLIDAPSVSRLVDRLEAEGLLVRKRGDDRRSVCLRLTPAGRRELQAMTRALDDFDAQVRRLLTRAEAKTLETLLEKIYCGVER